MGWVNWFQNVHIDDGLQGFIDNVGPAVASANGPIRQRTHGQLEHNTMSRHTILELLDKRVSYGYTSRAQMLREIRFHKAASDLNGRTLSNLKPDIAFLNKKTGKIDVIEVEWANIADDTRQGRLANAYGSLMGNYRTVHRVKTTRPIRHKTKTIPPGTLFESPRRR